MVQIHFLLEHISTKDLRKGQIRNLIISSPDRVMLKTIKGELEAIKRVNIGRMSFKIETISLFDSKLRRSCSLITGTPIVIRIPKRNYEKYSVKPPKDYDYVYWRNKYPFEVFVKQLESNLFKKYNKFYKTKLEEFTIFEQLLFKKEVCNHIIMDGKEQKVFGSVWEFIFSYLDEEKRKMLEFGLDSGFGELNSMGFGFMNVVK